MDAALSQWDRIRLLMGQGHWALAIDELQTLLIADGRIAEGHALLSLCLVERSEFDRAREEARLAIRLDQHNSLGHFASSVVSLRLNDFERARLAIEEAVRLQPSEPSYWAHIARLESELEQWEECLQAANDGLACDSGNVECRRFRELALSRIVERRGNERGGDETRLPSDAARLFNQEGWDLIEQGRPDEALERFREAAENDPQRASQSGIVRALQAKSLFYRCLLGLMAHFKHAGFGTRLIHIIMVWALHAYFAGQFGVAPMLKDHGNAIIYAFSFYTAFLICGSQLFDLVLLTSRYGRLVVGRSETVGALCIASCIVASWCMVAIGYLYFPGDENSWHMGYPPLLLTYSIAFAFYTRHLGRLAMAAYTIAYAVVVAITCTKWVSHSLDAADAMAVAIKNNQVINPRVLANLNARVTEVDQWIAYCGYGVFGALLVLRFSGAFLARNRTNRPRSSVERH